MESQYSPSLPQQNAERRKYREWVQLHRGLQLQKSTKEGQGTGQVLVCRSPFNSNILLLLPQSPTLILALLFQTLLRKGSGVARAEASLQWWPGHGSPDLWEKGSKVPSGWTHTMQHQLASRLETCPCLFYLLLQTQPVKPSDKGIWLLVTDNIKPD